MRAGDTINGYTLVEDFRVVGAGLSEWTFATRGGQEFFIKRFLSPTYLDDSAPGSPKTKARKRARCAAFEAHHRGIQAALAPVTSYGGNLIATLDFFRVGAKYYKVTEKVDVAGMSAGYVAALDFPAQLVLLKTVAHSLKILHDLRIVHSDLKPSNVLIKRTELGHTTKLIDFDSSYIVGSPPPPEEIVGTMNYYSPELVRYIQGGAAPDELTPASDIFALGLIYTEYLTGAPPAFDASHHEPSVAVLNGARLQVSPAGLPPTVVDLVDRMMSAEPAQRPSIAEVHGELMGIRSGRATSAVVLGTTGRVSAVAGPAAVRSSAAAASGGAGAVGAGAVGAGSPRPRAAASALRGKGLRLVAGSPSAEAARTSGDRTGALVGRLLNRLGDRRPR